MMTFVDEFTHRAVVYFLKYKHEAFKCFKHYVIMLREKPKSNLSAFTQIMAENTLLMSGKPCVKRPVSSILWDHPTLPN